MSASDPLLTLGMTGYRTAMSNSLVRVRVASVVVLTMLTGCSLEDFQVTPCSANGRLAFRIHEISGWLRDYQPRPGLIIVGAWERGPATWAVRENSLAERPARKVAGIAVHLVLSRHAALGATDLLVQSLDPFS